MDTGSGPTLMAATESPNVFQPFGNGYFQLTSVRGGFIGRDAQGRTWTFRTVPALFDADFFPLMSIVDAGGTNRVDFRYEVFDKFSPDPITPPFNPDEVSMRELCWPRSRIRTTALEPVPSTRFISITSRGRT